jgi:hypothetical protein
MEIVFYKSVEHPGYYLLYKGANGVNAERKLRTLTNTGEFENSGYPKIDIEMGFVLKTDTPDKFFDFLVEHIATNHIPHPNYNVQNFRAWFEFTDITKKENWIESFKTYNLKNYADFLKSTDTAIQKTLF